MARYEGINRAYKSKGEEKSPAERQRELDEKMKEFLAKGGQIKKEKTKIKSENCSIRNR